VNFTYVTVAAPVITALSPTNNGPASGGNTVSICGTNLLYTTGVFFGTTAASSFAILLDDWVVAVAPAGTGATTVSVTNGTGASNTLPYTYNVAGPVVSTVCPTSGPAAGGNTVVINVFGFTNATAVTFGSKAATFTVVSKTVINAVVPPGPSAGGKVSVVIIGYQIAAATTYTYIAAPAPTAVFPTAGVTAGGDIVAITGTGLTGTTSVKFGTTPATSFTVISDTEVDAITPMHVVGTVPINITTPGGTNSSLSFSFQPSPVINSITPTSGPITGGTVVTITGAGLIDTIGVNFGTTPATGFTVGSDNTVTAIAPAKAAGVCAVTVITAFATSNGATFIYVAAPTLTGLSPTGGPIVGGNNVTLTGTGFLTATDVFFGANPAAFTILDDTLISAVAPSGTGAVSVTVTNPGGTSGARTYTYS
jgi:hypothetical protein